MDDKELLELAKKLKDDDLWEVILFMRQLLAESKECKTKT